MSNKKKKKSNNNNNNNKSTLKTASASMLAVKNQPKYSIVMRNILPGPKCRETFLFVGFVEQTDQKA